MKIFKFIVILGIFSLCTIYVSIGEGSETEIKNPIIRIGTVRNANRFFQLLAELSSLYIDYIGYIRTGLKLAKKYQYLPNTKLGFLNGYFGLLLRSKSLDISEIALVLKYPQLNIAFIRGVSKEEAPVIAPAEEKTLTQVEESELFELYQNEKIPGSIKLSIGFLFLRSFGIKIKKIEDNLITIKERSIIQQPIKLLKKSLQKVFDDIVQAGIQASEVEEALKSVPAEYEDVLKRSNKLIELANDLEQKNNRLKRQLETYQENSFPDFNQVYQDLLKEVSEVLQKKLPVSLSSITFEQEPSTASQLQKELGLENIKLEPGMAFEELKPKPKKKVHKKPVKKKVPKKKEEKPKEEIEELEEEPEEVPKLKEEKKEEEIPALATNTIVIQDDSFNATITLFKAKIAEQERPKIGSLKYTQSINEWFENPQQALAKKKGSMPKLKPGRKVEVTEERQIFLHAFSKKVDQYINECGKWKEFKNTRTENTDYFIQMPAQVKRAEESPYLAMVEYAVAERKGGSWLCYHRNLVEVSPQEFFTEWFGFDKAVIPESIYDIEFPPLQ